MMQMFPLAIMYLKSKGKQLSKDTRAIRPKIGNIYIFFQNGRQNKKNSTIFNSTIAAMTILMLKSTISVQGYIRSMCTFTMNNPIYIKNNGKQTR